MALRDVKNAYLSTFSGNIGLIARLLIYSVPIALLPLLL